jgi:hypothetical protein
VKGARTLHLFDTFDGLPPPEAADAKKFWRGKFRSDFDGVKAYLDIFPAVHLYKGMFPDTAAPVEQERFCFVHLDVDLHASTKASLEFFYPRLVPGGIIMSHDYSAEGVRRAVDDFFVDKPEPVFRHAGGAHCFAVKLG